MTKKKRPHDADPEPAKCKSCNSPYTDHAGIQGTCAKLQDALSALKVIKTWATFRDGVALTPEHVAKLCDKVLKASVTT